MIKVDTLTITPEILGTIAEIDEFKGAWRAIEDHVPSRFGALRHVATIESIGSSTRIEGSQLADEEVEKLLANLQVEHFETRDEQEVAGYAEVMELVLQSWQDINLTENHIKQLHSSLLRHSEKDDRHSGEYKASPNSVAAFDAVGKQASVVFETATPFEAPELMREIVAWTNEAMATRSLHALLVIAVFVVVFLEIHPFQDGNGRLSRVLTTLLLLRAGYAYVPYSSLESVVEKSKEDYYLALRQTQGTIRSESPNWQPWISYFVRALLLQTRNLAAKAEQDKPLAPSLPKLSQQILEHAKQHGQVTIASMVALTDANRNTLKKHFKTLTAKGRLVMHGKARASWYELP